MFLKLRFFLGGEFAFTGQRQDALAVLVVLLAIEGFVTDVDTLAVSGEFIAAGEASGSGVLNCGWGLLLSACRHSL